MQFSWSAEILFDHTITKEHALTYEGGFARTPYREYTLHRTQIVPIKITFFK